LIERAEGIARSMLAVADAAAEVGDVERAR
jgi:hypothetical protein